jgi:hypothetical protein
MPRDYIMRMVEQIAAMLASILARREAGYVEQARQEMDGHCLRTVGLTLERLKGLSPEAVAQLLAENGALQPVRAVTLVELLLIDAELNEEQGKVAEAMPSRVHAACLLADSIEALGSEDRVIYREKLKGVADKLGELRTHPYISERLRRHGL